MADRPQDQPKPVRSGLPATVRPSEIGAREVKAYLREHPDFLDRQPDALRLLRAPTRQTGDGVLDFQHFMLERLRSDNLYEQAIEIVVREGRGSVSLLQRTLGIGYGRAARLIDFMAEDGLVGTYNGSNAREVLCSPERWDEIKNNRQVAAS